MSKERCFWLLGIAGVAAIVLIVGAMALDPRPRETTPPYALTNDAVLERFGRTFADGGAGYVRVAMHRRHPQQASFPMRLLVWVPAASALLTMVMWLATHRKERPVVAASVMLVSGAVGLFWTSWPKLMTVSALVGAAALLSWRFHVRRLPASTFHLLVVMVLITAGFAQSCSTHRILNTYAGWPLGSQTIETMMNSVDAMARKAAPSVVEDDAAWRVDGLPALNDVSAAMTLFGVNYLAACVFIGVAVIYLFISVTVVRYRHRRDARIKAKHDTTVAKQNDIEPCIQPARQWSRPVFALVRILLALCLYGGTGVAFAGLYYNIYLTAAAKQNVMYTYAGYLQATVEESSRLEKLFARSGWSETLEQRMLAAARTRGNMREELGETIAKARARYWPSYVIAQETPQLTKAADGTTRVELTLDPNVSFHDMLYFSFVTFTTTGYGDIRPVSDELRLWTVLENIAELLFTGMFFAVAIEWGTE